MRKICWKDANTAFGMRILRKSPETIDTFIKHDMQEGKCQIITIISRKIDEELVHYKHFLRQRGGKPALSVNEPYCFLCTSWGDIQGSIIACILRSKELRVGLAAKMKDVAKYLRATTLFSSIRVFVIREHLTRLVHELKSYILAKPRLIFVLIFHVLFLISQYVEILQRFSISGLFFDEFSIFGT